MTPVFADTGYRSSTGPSDVAGAIEACGECLGKLYLGVSTGMGEVGLEPTWPCGRQILSLLCLPFHHSPATRRTGPWPRGQW
jgi:hypothetical protein